VGLIGNALNAAFEAFATTPDCAVSGLKLLPAAELQALLAPPAPADAPPSAPVSGGSVETERALIALLEELLDITGVDREDNFFAIGGDSIVSVQLAARATAQGMALTPAMVFQHMTIAELAAAVDAAADPEAQAHSVPGPPPVNASGLDADALAALRASWMKES
jgi:mycobactin peptide synthetase MbtE